MCFEFERVLSLSITRRSLQTITVVALLFFYDINYWENLTEVPTAPGSPYKPAYSTSSPYKSPHFLLESFHCIYSD